MLWMLGIAVVGVIVAALFRDRRAIREWEQKMEAVESIPVADESILDRTSIIIDAVPQSSSSSLGPHDDHEGDPFETVHARLGLMLRF